MRYTRKKSEKAEIPAGDPILLAIVFFLLCLFVGGSVLAAATANGGRIVNQKAVRQDYYTQRSAALLLQDQFSNAAQLNINMIAETKMTITSGGTTSVVLEKTYSTRFVESENQTKLQDLVSRAVANLFWSNNTLGTSYSDYFKPESKVYYNDVEIASADSSLYAGSGSLELLLQGSTQPIVVDYVCEFMSNEEFAGVTFIIKGDGGKSLFDLFVPASVNVQKSTGSKPSEDLNNVLVVTRIDTQSVIVTWGNPVIRKGGAS